MSIGSSINCLIWCRWLEAGGATVVTINHHAAAGGIYVSLEELVGLRRSGLVLRNGLAGLISGHTAGARRSRQRGQGLEFDELRPYQAGDDVRSIDWRVTARSGRTITKLFSEDREQQYLFAVDQTPSMFFGSEVRFKSVTAAHCAALLAWSALALGGRVGGVVAGQKITGVRDKNDRRAVLALLQQIVLANRQLRVTSRGEVTLNDILEQCLQRARSGSVVAVISDFSSLDDGTAALLTSLCRRATVLLVRISDPLQEQMAVKGRLGIGTGHHMTQVTVDRRTQTAYRQSVQLADQRLQALADQHAAAVLQLTGDRLLIDELQSAIGGGVVARG